MTHDEVAALYDVLLDGATAMQSLDDLGSREANAAAERDLLEIEHRLAQVGRALEIRRAGR